MPKEKYCEKSVCIRSFSGPYFPAFGLNIENRNEGKCGLENSKYGHFPRRRIHVTRKTKTS